MNNEQSKQRKNSLRLQGYFYGTDGGYFITICTKSRVHHFGKIVDGIMKLSALGKLVHEEWLRSEKIREEIVLDEFCIMPNHFHGIVWIAKNEPVSMPNHSFLPQTPGYSSKRGAIFRELETSSTVSKGVLQDKRGRR